MKLPCSIYSPAPNFKRFYMLAGIGVMSIAITGQLIWPQWLLLFGIMCLAAVAIFLVGFTKHFEPTISLALSRDTLRYFHRYGTWSLDWSCVSRIHIPRFTYGLEQREISYIGIKINDLESLVEKFSPRLASRIIHEHRDILALAISQGEMNSAQAQINFLPYKFESGYQVDGPLAACLHQMEQLNAAYGAHLYVPFSCFSVDANELVNQMNIIRKMH